MDCASDLAAPAPAGPHWQGILRLHVAVDGSLLDFWAAATAGDIADPSGIGPGDGNHEHKWGGDDIHEELHHAFCWRWGIPIS